MNCSLSLIFSLQNEPSIIAATGTGTIPANFSTVSPSLRGGAALSSASAPLDQKHGTIHHQILASTPFILGKRMRTKEEGDESLPSDGGVPTGGFWAVPAARMDFGQIWSFGGGVVAAPELVMSAAAGRYVQAMGEASAARFGNYLPIVTSTTTGQGHLDLLASLSANSGTRD